MVALQNNEKEISDLFIKVGRIQNIVMSFILFAFIVFGQPFVILWAGEEYKEAYVMTLLFFVALYIPLIQNLGITILQARNKMRFRSLLYIVIAAFALLAEYLLAKVWGGIGCAIAVSIALLLGQGLIMNIYYQVKQKLNIVEFWKEIIKMNAIPLLVSAFFYWLTHSVIPIDSWLILIGMALLYTLVYVATCGRFSINAYEKELIFAPLMRRLRR